MKGCKHNENYSCDNCRDTIREQAKEKTNSRRILSLKQAQVVWEIYCMSHPNYSWEKNNCKFKTLLDSITEKKKE